MWSSHLAGIGHMGSGSGEGVPLDVLPVLYLFVVAPLVVQSSSATLPNLSRPQLWSSHLAGAHERQAFDHRCGRVAKLALEKAEGSVALPSGHRPPEPGKGRRPKNRHSSKAKRVSALVSCLPVLACLCRGFPGSGSLVLFFVPPHVSFHWPRASRSSSRREGRRVKRRGTDPRTGTGRRPKDRLFQVPLYVRLSCVASLCLTCSFPSSLLFIFPRMLWALQWLSRTQWYKTSPQVLSGFCRSPGEAQAALDERRRFRWSSPFILQGYRSNVCFVGCPCQSTC